MTRPAPMPDWKASAEAAEARIEAVKAIIDESVHVLHPHASNPWQAALNDVRAALSAAPLAASLPVEPAKCEHGHTEAHAFTYRGVDGIAQSWCPGPVSGAASGGVS